MLEGEKMNNVEFIKAIKALVRDGAISDIIENLEDPPGRRPAKELVEVSNWYNEMGESDKLLVRTTISMAVDTAIFGMLAVIDGVRILEDLSNGSFKLNYEGNGKTECLNNQDDEFLHDMFQQEISE
jgi:hypothetical protein